MTGPIFAASCTLPSAQLRTDVERDPSSDVTDPLGRLKLALQPLQLMHDCITRERQGWTHGTFIIFESSFDNRVRFTFGQLDAVVSALQELEQ
jgi:hypothetical protein